jgi:hypothetical protein
MKKLLLIIFICTILFAGCKKDPDSVSVVAKVGHPKVVLTGVPALTLAVASGPYVDAGAKAYDDLLGDSVVLTSPVSNNVDMNTPGFYSVRYEYSNSNGLVTYTDAQTRYVLVSNVDPNQDLSGVYARTSNGVLVNFTKYAPGIYITDNVGGVANNPSFIFDIYVGVINDSTIEVPSQATPFGDDLYCDNAFLRLTPDTAFSWVVHEANFGTSQRTFVKQ